ncbi:uncharacterized protein Bfra_011017 [Botrytis fragariae]|uniref:Uncharacterized protein n=1 Tax=Botrytis fragariae TaxID=1964551 RepID=A0A8H6ALS5_9HELO|nr:uncharacterized protein Bfra_011017 [Botrytis fragariae]KAF5869817.1 hypothetical protein Bfra_011017 [Botrytis fragariae]
MSQEILVTITTVVLNEITYTEASTNIVYVTARDVKPGDVVIVTATGDAITLTTTLKAITSTATEIIPPYATSACPNHSAYVEACQSHLSVVIATITITASTSYITEYTTVNLPGTSFESSITAPGSNIVGTISAIPSTDVQGPTSGSSSSSSSTVVVDSTPLVIRNTSSAQSSGTSINLSTKPSATTKLNTEVSTSTTTIAPSAVLFSLTFSAGSLSSGSSAQATVPLNPFSSTFGSDSASSQSTSTTFLSNSPTSSAGGSLPSSIILPSTFSTISTSNSLVSSLNISYTTPSSSTSTGFSISSSTTSSSSVSAQSSSSTTSLTSLSSTFSTVTSQLATDSSLTSTSFPISSSSPVPRPPVSPLIATCNAPSACRQNQYCSSDNTCLCRMSHPPFPYSFPSYKSADTPFPIEPTVNGTGYCMADTPCAALSSCTIDSDCGIGSACMRTCCSANKCLSLQGLCQNPNMAIVIFKRGEEGSRGHRMVGEIGDGEEEEEWTNRGPWVKRLGKM